MSATLRAIGCRFVYWLDRWDGALVVRSCALGAKLRASGCRISAMWHRWDGATLASENISCRNENGDCIPYRSTVRYTNLSPTGESSAFPHCMPR